MPEADDSMEAGRSDWRTLTERVADVLPPGSSGYEDVRKLAGRRFDHIRPQAVVRCRSEQDVAEALRFARARNIPSRSAAAVTTSPVAPRAAVWSST